jgi:capsular polysaccharide transport system permease protein
MWSVLRGPIERGGLHLIPFLWTGYLPLLLFRHVTGTAVRCVAGNAAVMYHRAITPLDIFVGHCGLEAIGVLGAGAFSFLLMYATGFLPWPVNLPLFITGWLYMAWWGLAVALIVAAASEHTHLIEHIWPPISYMYLPVCGFFYLAQWLPDTARVVALTVMPPLHAYEMIRSGLFGLAIQAYYDVPYLTFVLACLTLVGLWLLRDVRRYLEL